MIADLIKANRSCRRFDEAQQIPLQTLIELVELARLSPSAANLQPLKYILSSEPAANARIFDCLKWAGYLEDWPGPQPGERPAAYIIVLHDTRICKAVDCDHGIVSQSMLLGAREKGLAGCMLAAINKPRLSEAMKIESHFNAMLVIALGKPKEKIVIEVLNDAGDIRYWRDADMVHHVPKRSVDNIILNSF